MMRITDEKIFKMALITSLIGIIGLIIFTPSIEVKETEISEINREIIDEEVAVRGIVEEVDKSSSSNTYFLTVNDMTGRIPVIIFESVVSELEDSQTPVEIFKDKKVEVIGTVTEYNSNMELILSDESSIKIAE